MINVIKGIFIDRRSCDEDEKSTALVFRFRDHKFCVNNIEKKDEKPYLGAILNKQQVLALAEWLKDALTLDGACCDACYGWRIPDEYDFIGEVNCKNCGNLILRRAGNDEPKAKG